MKRYKLTHEQTMELVVKLGHVGRFSEFVVADLQDPQGAGIQEDTYLFLGQEGTWQWRTIGNSYSHTEIDSTMIAGPLTEAEYQVVSDYCEANGSDDVNINKTDLLYINADLKEYV
jgi:hypothetical protein